MNLRTISSSLSPVFALLLFAACGGSSYGPHSAEPANPAPLSSGNLNLVFVVSEDLPYQASGDMNPATANLTDQGLQRSLLTATYLQQKVLGAQNVTQVYALAPTTHLQTANNYPDMVGLETIQQFAMLNQATLFDGTWYTSRSFPIHASYADVPVLPEGIVRPDKFCSNCQGLDFTDQNGDNEALVTGIVKANVPGFYVFSAPWETVSALMANINQSQGYGLALPASYVSPNFIYAIAITPSGSASLNTYDSHITPPVSYPVLSPPPASTACATPFSIVVNGGQGGAVVPAGINTNETLYFIRHADAHPQTLWNDNNYVGAGQWRALDLPDALAGKMSPTQVYSIDPSQFGVGSISAAGDHNWSTVAPALTAAPYAIANGLPYKLVTSFEVSDPQADAQPISDFFFFMDGGKFSNQTVLVAWAFQFIEPAVNALLAGYHGNNQPAPAWSSDDYDSIWTIKLDAVGNITVSNATCEGISSASLPPTPPQF